MAEGPSLSDRVQNSFCELSNVASDLNSASDELVATIAELNAALKLLNLGISAWVRLSGDDDERGDWWSRDVGYAKIENEWGIALRKAAGNYNHPDEDVEDKWKFADAPRWMRINAVGKIPDLLEKLTKEAESTTKKLKNKTEEAKEITAAIKVLTGTDAQKAKAR